MKNRNIERIAVGVALGVIAILFVCFFKDILVPLFSMELDGDFEGARAMLETKGWLGAFCVILIEALQMVVIFIPAEFIQVSSGLSYPFHMSMILCDLGVCLGATLIFLLTRICRFSTERSCRSRKDIDRISAKTGSKGVMILMYILFITPIVPFGAICYYGSSTNISYRRYIFTVATGVIPSIITSNLIGASAKAFIQNAIPVWLLVIIIVLLMALLLVMIWFLLDKVIFRKGERSPDSATYFLFFKLVNMLRRRRQRLHLDNALLEGVKPPYIVLCNHASFYDFYYVKQLLGDVSPYFVVNSHIVSPPLRKRLSDKAGMIPKNGCPWTDAAIR